MSEIFYEFTFFKTHPGAFKKITESVSNELSTSELLESLDLTRHLDEEREHLESFDLHDDKLKLEFCNSTSSRFNHALVRAFKDYGCEFCHATVFNSQVGEGNDFYLHRGKEVSGKQCQDMLDKFNPGHQISEFLKPGNSGLSEALQGGLDPDMIIDGDPLLIRAFYNENKPAFDTLLGAGANVNLVRPERESLVFEVADSLTSDPHGFLSALVENGADIDKTDSDGRSFLWCLGRGDPALTQILLAKGKQLIRPENAYLDADPIENLCEALEHNDLEKCEPFFAECARNTSGQHELAMLCARFDYADGLTKLLDSGYNAFPESVPNRDSDEDNTALADFVDLDHDHDDDEENSQFEVLYEAVSENSYNVINVLLSIAERTGIDYSSEAGSYTYALASNPAAIEVLTAIIKKHPEAANHEALSQAVEANCVVNARSLVDSGAAVSKEEEESLLHSHLHTLLPEMFSFLVENGCDPFETGHFEEDSAIERALSENEVREDTRNAIVSWLDSSDDTDVMYQYANLDMYDKFMARWKNMSADERKEVEVDTLMYSAAISNNARIVGFCLEQGMDANHRHESGASLLELATVTSGHSVISVLLKNGANPDTLFDLEAISAASASFNEQNGSDEDDYEDDDEDEDDESVNVLLRAMGISDDDTPEYIKQADKSVNDEVSVSSNTASCLMFSASTGDERSVALFLAAKADVTLSSEEGEIWTALTYAVINGHTHCVSMLLDAGAKISGADETGNTLVHFAALRGHSDVLEILLKANAPAEERTTDDGQTPLILACVTAVVREDDTTIDLLLNHGADVNAVDNAKLSALTYACTIAKEPLIATLLINGADVNQVSRTGNTPYDLFKAHGIKPTSFEMDQLKPTANSVKFKKGMSLVKTTISRLAVAGVLLALIGFFIGLTAGLIVAVLYLGWPLMMAGFRKMTSGASSENELDDEEFEEDDRRNTGSGFLQLGVNALLNAQAEAEKMADNDEQIIDSWDDEEKAA